MRKFAALLMTLLITGSIFALGKAERNRVQPRKVEVSGKVRLVGNSPMTSLVISSADHSGESREWRIESGEEKKLIHLQQQTVKISAHEYYQDHFFANGIPAGRFYFLKNIVVIEPKNQQPRN